MDQVRHDAHQNSVRDFIEMLIRLQTLDPFEVRRLYLEHGFTASQLAEHFGASKQTILARLRRVGVSKTSRSGRCPKNYRYRNPPYGLKVLNGCLIPDRREMRVVRKILELRRIGFGWMQIAGHLNAADIPSRSRKPWRRMGVKRVYMRWLDKA